MFEQRLERSLLSTLHESSEGKPRIDNEQEAAQFMIMLGIIVTFALLFIELSTCTFWLG